MVQVNLGRAVPYEKLEKALVSAAKDVGWDAKVEHRYEREFDLGSVSERETYSRTIIYLKGRFFPAAQVWLNRECGVRELVFIEWGFPFGMASERRIKRYLSAVSRELSSPA